MNEKLGNLASQIRELLSVSDPEWWEERAREADALRIEAREAARDDEANVAWFLRAVATSRGDFTRAFQLMQSGEFRDAWDLLERAEIATEHLKRNPFLSLEAYAIEHFEAAIERWQGLYPYAVFLSPEFVVKRATCNICEKDLNPWAPCGHQATTVYAGEMAVRVIRDAVLISVSLVPDPVQKYSVVLPEKDPFDYALARYVVERLRGPFSDWGIQTTTKFHDHELFAEWAPDDDCPCGSSRSYGACCLPSPGVRLPHKLVSFSDPIPDDLPNFVLRPPLKHRHGQEASTR